MKQIGPKQVFSSKELGELLDMTPRILREMTARLPGAQIRVGKHVYITREGVKAALAFNDSEYAELVRLAKQRQMELAS